MSTRTLSLAFRELTVLPPRLAAKYPSLTTLDVTSNRLADLRSLEDLPSLTSLVADDNVLHASSPLPRLPHLHTLSVNKNEITSLPMWLERVKEAFPSLRFLSMLNNAACPNYFTGGTPKQYKDFRYYVVSRLPNLAHLDSSPVTDHERAEAARLYATMPKSLPSALVPATTAAPISPAPPPPVPPRDDIAPSEAGSAPVTPPKAKKAGKKKNRSSAAANKEKERIPAYTQSTPASNGDAKYLVLSVLPVLPDIDADDSPDESALVLPAVESLSVVTTGAPVSPQRQARAVPNDEYGDDSDLSSEGWSDTEALDPRLARDLLHPLKTHAHAKAKAKSAATAKTAAGTTASADSDDDSIDWDE